MLVTTGITFVFHAQILEFLMEPARGFEGVPNEKPVYTDLTEFIGVAFKVSLLSGFILALPYVLYQIVMFVTPGLKKNERRYLFILLPVSLLAFLAGAAFGHQVLFPPAVRFLLSFGSDVATPFIRIGGYTSIMLTLLFWMGVVFETPVVTFFLAKIGVVSGNFLARQRRYALVASFVMGAIITPTFDPINQGLVALPIMVMYELGIWSARLGERGRKKAD
jgi:sec-independent protein translocase protein TatC